MALKGLKNRAESDPRALALLALEAVLHGEADSQAALDLRLKNSKLVPSDKGLATEIFYGTLRLHLRLAWFLEQMLPRPEKLPREMFLLLELAAYELAHTRIPPHASVDSAVNLTKNRFGAGLAKVANGVLRAFQRNLKQEYLNPAFYARKLGLLSSDQPEPGQPEAWRSEPAFLALFHAAPEWLADLWLKSYGPENTLALLQAGLSPAPLSLRLNLTRSDGNQLKQAFLNEEGATFLPPAGILTPKGSAQPLRLLQQEGRISRQSAGAYAALQALQPQSWAGPVWDACAGRGGKTLALLEQNIPVALASDPNADRLEGLRQDFERLKLAEAGAELPRLLTGRAEEAGQSAAFSTILVDAPCSGLGTLAHRPEIRWRRAPDDLNRLCATQRNILEAAFRALKPGGRIAYLTCTLNPAENEDQVAALLARHPGLRLELSWQTPPDSPQGEFFYAALIGLR